jgi:hypothetical protein
MGSSAKNTVISQSNAGLDDCAATNSNWVHRKAWNVTSNIFQDVEVGLNMGLVSITTRKNEMQFCE